VHLGNRNARPDILLKVLKKYDFDKLIIVGDFIDLTSLKRKFFWNNDTSNVIQKILKYSRKENKETIYILGNHDCYIRSLITDGNINLGNIVICNEHIHITSKNERIYITHGDCFDGFIRMHPFLYWLGDTAYELSITINKTYNKLRAFFGLEYWSLSKYLKTKVKNVIKFINEYEKMSVNKLKEVGCDSIMIGHTHSPDIIQGKYYNTGDFCETCSFIAEHLNGEMELIFVI
jgi:UDP-2,3-diacylglucosamine pyrophosphatase LpxH